MTRVEVGRAHSEVSVIKAQDKEEAKKDLELPQMSCFTCKFVMSEGKRVLEEDSTVQQLANLAESVCKDLQPDLKVILSILLVKEGPNSKINPVPIFWPEAPL